MSQLEQWNTIAKAHDLKPWNTSDGYAWQPVYHPANTTLTEGQLTQATTIPCYRVKSQEQLTQTTQQLDPHSSSWVIIPETLTQKPQANSTNHVFFHESMLHTNGLGSSFSWASEKSELLFISANQAVELGATPAQEISTLALTIAELLDRAPSLATEPNWLIQVHASNLMLESMAAIKAFHLCWQQIQQSHPALPSRAQLLVRSHPWDWSPFDPLTNLNRTTFQALAGYLSGATAVELSLYSSRTEEYAEAMRLSQNQHLLLKDEAQLGNPNTLWTDSLALEEQATNIARQAWEIFLRHRPDNWDAFKIEITASGNIRQQRRLEGKEIIIGGNTYPQPGLTPEPLMTKLQKRLWEDFTTLKTLIIKGHILPLKPLSSSIQGVYRWKNILEMTQEAIPIEPEVTLEQLEIIVPDLPHSLIALAATSDEQVSVIDKLAHQFPHKLFLVDRGNQQQVSAKNLLLQPSRESSIITWIQQVYQRVKEHSHVS